MGKQGSIVGVDLSDQIVEFSRHNIEVLIAQNHEGYKDVAAPIHFQKTNVFLAPKEFEVNQKSLTEL